MNETRDQHQNEKVTVERRRRIEATGVKDIRDMDDTTITLVTDDGCLVVEGADLHIIEMSQETKKVTAEGEITGLYYRYTAPKNGLFRKKT